MNALDPYLLLKDKECCVNEDSDLYNLNKTPAEAFTPPKSAQTEHLCTTVQAGADPGIFVCRSKFPGLKSGEEVLISKYGIAIEHMKQKEQYHSFSACVDAGYDIKESITDIPRDIQKKMQ